MKNFLIIAVACLLICIAMLILFVSGTALAEESEVIDLIPVKAEVPEAIPAPVDTRAVEIRSHEIDKEDVEVLARLLWSSPLREEKYKKALCWIVFNRIDNNSGLFGDSIKECVNRHEFAFYDPHAHRSDANLKLARECINAWLSEKEGCNVGSHIGRLNLYIRFSGHDNRAIEVSIDRHNWKGVYDV